MQLLHLPATLIVSENRGNARKILREAHFRPTIVNNRSLMDMGNPATNSSPASVRDELVRNARVLLGKPYRYGAKPEEAPDAFDCSSFTQYLYRSIGIDIPRSSILQAAHGTLVAESFGRYVEHLLLPGDLFFLRGTKGHYDDSLFGSRRVYVGHVALYAGNNCVIHAKSPEGVIEERIAELEARGPDHKIILVKRVLA